MSSKTEQSGPIRFVGGPLHNQIVTVSRWMPIISVPVEAPKSYWQTSCDSTPIVFATEHYQLQQPWVVLSYRGALKFWEYHHQEMDANHAVSSGGDGVCTHMKITRRS